MSRPEKSLKKLCNQFTNDVELLLTRPFDPTKNLPKPTTEQLEDIHQVAYNLAQTSYNLARPVINYEHLAVDMAQVASDMAKLASSLSAALGKKEKNTNEDEMNTSPSPSPSPSPVPMLIYETLEGHNLHPVELPLTRTESYSVPRSEEVMIQSPTPHKVRWIEPGCTIPTPKPTPTPTPTLVSPNPVPPPTLVSPNPTPTPTLVSPNPVPPPTPTLVSPTPQDQLSSTHHPPLKKILIRKKK
jgi:hypothetical protein